MAGFVVIHCYGYVLQLELALQSSQDEMVFNKLEKYFSKDSDHSQKCSSQMLAKLQALASKVL